MPWLSPVMEEAMRYARNAGKLVRLPGGFWTVESSPRHAHNGHPEWSVGTPTVKALVARGELAYSRWQDGRHGPFPIEAAPVRGAV